jgi:dTDP-4-dehydrorhamnose 3,5-epimerase
VIQVVKTKFEGVLVIEAQAHEDERGIFVESYNEEVFRSHGIHARFMQDNHSISWTPRTLRGLHYQLEPKGQTKLVRVVSGAIFDVVVDIRRNSPTFGQWLGVMLSKSNRRQLIIPRGFAHGFCTMVPNTEVLYKVDEAYSPEHDRGILWNDPELNIEWPCVNPILSEKDRKQPLLRDAAPYEGILDEIKRLANA